MSFIVISYDLHVTRDGKKDAGAHERVRAALKTLEFYDTPTATTWRKEYLPLDRPQAAAQAKRQFEKAMEKAGVDDYDLVIFSSEESIELDIHKGRPRKS